MTLLNKNYFFSGWIENFGVDPLFLSAAFLLAPDFLVFIFLLHSVILVLEAILNSLFKLKKQSLYLTLRCSYVKDFLLIPLLIATFIFIPIAHSKTIFLAKGEQESINIKTLTNFSIGNPEVISVKFRPESGSLLIKAKSLGYSDLIVWRSESEKIKYEIYSTSKLQQVKRIQLEKALKKAGLSSQWLYGSVTVSGLIKNHNQYQLIKKIKSLKKWNIRTTLDPNFRNEVIGNIYSILLDQGADFISCDEIHSQIFCKYSGEINKDIIGEIERKYLTSFTKLKNIQNYKIEYQIVQISENELKDTKLGIDQISLKLHRVLNATTSDLDQFIKVHFQKLNAKVIAAPMIKTGLEIPNSIELGSSIPYQSQSEFGNTTTWKFAGLKVKNILSLNQKSLVLNYETELSHPIGDTVNGSKAKGLVYLKENIFEKVFEITYENSDKVKNYIPFIGQIPVLGLLFSSNQSSKGLKHIIGFIKVTKE